MDTLTRAFDDSNWPLALALLLERWRAERTPQLADLIDRVGARCGSPPPPDADLQRWWIEHARPYDAEMASRLVEHAGVRARASDEMWATIRERWPGNALIEALASAPELPQHRNWIERVVAMLAWPDDPRMSRVLATWLAGEDAMVRTASMEIRGAISERLAELGDTRVAAMLDDGDELVESVRLSLSLSHDRPPVPDDPQLAALAAVVGVPGAELAPLWRAVGERPDDLGARTVLGDALVAAGDPRGELISLQLAPPHDAKRDRRIKRLLETWWEHWLGPDLAAIAVRDGTEYVRGMLEVLSVGRPQSPRGAWEAARGHRELSTVHTLRIHRAAHIPPVGYARLAASLPHLATLEVDAPEALHELGALGPLSRLHALAYVPPAHRVGLPPARATFEAFAPAAPSLARLSLDPTPIGAELDGLVAALPALFPQLRAIELRASSRVAARELTERFAAAPLTHVTTR